MKKVLFSLLAVALMTACQQSTKETVSSDIPMTQTKDSFQQMVRHNIQNSCVAKIHKTHPTLGHLSKEMKEYCDCLATLVIENSSVQEVFRAEAGDKKVLNDVIKRVGNNITQCVAK